MHLTTICNLGAPVSDIVKLHFEEINLFFFILNVILLGMNIWLIWKNMREEKKIRFSTKKTEILRSIEALRGLCNQLLQLIQNYHELYDLNQIYEALIVQCGQYNKTIIEQKKFIGNIYKILNEYTKKQDYQKLEELLTNVKGRYNSMELMTNELSLKKERCDHWRNVTDETLVKRR